jgi:hypothetical protein
VCNFDHRKCAISIIVDINEAASVMTRKADAPPERRARAMPRFNEAASVMTRKVSEAHNAVAQAKPLQ